MKTASLPIKVARVGFLLALSVTSAQAQTPKYDMSGTSPESRRVFNRILGNTTPSWNPFRRSTTTNNGGAIVVQPTAGQTVVVQPNLGQNNLGKPLRYMAISLRCAPTIGLNTAVGKGQYAGFQPNGIGVRYSIGPTIDYFFYRDRYAFSTGLWFTVRRSAYEMPGTFGQQQFTPGLPDQKSVYNLQYLQVPFILKLLANDLLPKVQFYAETGAIVSVRTAEIGVDPSNNGLYRFAWITGTYLDQYRPTDLDWTMGAGLQYHLGPTSAILFGISYQRGLTTIALANDLDSRTRTISVDLGFKF